MKRLRIILTAILLITAIVMPAEAKRSTSKGIGYGFCKDNDLTNVEGLNLTAEQKERITDFRATLLRDVKPIQDKIKSKQTELKNLWSQKNLDEAKIRDAERAIRALRDQINEKSTDYRWKVYRILTPAQQVLLKQNRATSRCFGPRPDTDRDLGSAISGNLNE
jgi:Spy/CpxP family protein refolding chaperone